MPPGGAEEARAFFGGALGLVEKQVPASLDASQLTWFSVGDDEHELHCYVDPDYENRSSAAHFCFEVEDIEALRTRVREAGLVFDHDPAPIHNRPRSFVRDPFGNLIEFTQINGRYEEV
jgi:catechol 2,3-dioxygenase-like lactoylglutathione lyase family enzyme